LATLLFSIFPSCKGEDGPDNPGITDETYKPVKLTPISGLRVAWDYSSLAKLANKGSYPKMVRISGQTLVAVYESGDSIYMIISNDNGVTWGMPVTLFGKTTHQGKDGEVNITFTDLMTEPSVIQLSNGDIVAACGVIYQYTKGNVVTEYPAGILTRRFSTDGSMEAIQQIYSNLGCQKPCLLELPDGELQLYFANSTASETVETMSSTGLLVTYGEQQIEMIHSKDGGKTWSGYIGEFGPDGIEKRWTGAKIISYRSGKINNSPSAAILGNNIVLAYGDNRNVTFKPYIVRTSLGNSWPYPVNGDSPDREYAFYEILPEKNFMGYPDLLILPSGESLLAYETDADRMDGFEVLEVAISDKDALNFTKATRPLGFIRNARSVLNSLMLFDDNTVIALTTSNYQPSSDDAPWYIKGHLINDLTITDAAITDYPVFVGGLSEANVRVGLGIDDSNLYIEAKGIDGTPVPATAGSQNGDGIYLYIDAANLSLLDVDTGISRLWISAEGDITRWDGKEGEWLPVSSGGITAVSVKNEPGYTLSITIPKSSLTNFNNGGIRFGVGLSDYSDMEKYTIELLSQCKDLRSSSWLGVKF
jgi:hypothetical protein